jgi:hypothetical protein
MEKFRPDSHCGLYCGACDVMVTFKQGLQSGKLPVWQDLPEVFINNIPTGKKDEIKCHGCKSDVVFGGCSKCLIRKCAKEKMNVEFCFECKKHPCLRYKIQRFITKLIFEKKLPHLKSIEPNQKKIQMVGVEKWLEDQQNKWQCPECSSEISWYQNTCPHCDMHNLPTYTNSK